MTPGLPVPGAACAPCVPPLVSAHARLQALQAAIADEPDPVTALTYLLRTCRDEHQVLWEAANDADPHGWVAAVIASIDDLLPAEELHTVIPAPVRAAMTSALNAPAEVPPVVVARALAALLDRRFHHTFAAWFRRRSPYQPALGDPIPLDSPDLRNMLAMPVTAPPWRLANRLDETRHIRLAGGWVVQFRVVFDYSLVDTLTGLIGADTLIATCHPNRELAEFDLTATPQQPGFPIQPRDLTRQADTLDRLMAASTVAGAAVVVLPELCLTEPMAMRLQQWVRRPDGPRLLVAGSYHHDDPHGTSEHPRRRNTAIAWVRGHDHPLTHDKHSAAEQPVPEALQPDGWPELRVYVTTDGWHIVIAICRDLLNPQAVHALTEAGANLVLVPAMSESLMPFGGPVAQLVADCQAVVAVANNPAVWAHDGARSTPARALFGHPGLSRQSRLIRTPNLEPGIAVHSVRTGTSGWIPDPGKGPERGHAPGPFAPRPKWAEELAGRLASPTEREPGQAWPVVPRDAAVLLLLVDGSDGPGVLLTQRSRDLTDYPGQYVFPGGARQPGDEGPVTTALREAHEEVGLDPALMDVLGVLPPIALPDTGFLVTPVLAWRPGPGPEYTPNPDEVAVYVEVPLRKLVERTGTGRGPRLPTDDDDPIMAVAANLGHLTGILIDLVAGLVTVDPSCTT